MNFSNLNFDYLLTNGLKFSLDLVKKNVTKAVSDNAFKVVKNVVFGRNSKKNLKNNNIRLKAGDSVTFVVTKRGLENVISDDVIDEHNLLPTEEILADTVSNVCLHPKSEENAFLCEYCLKNRLKSKL